jgi:hypothetical protein
VSVSVLHVFMTPYNLKLGTLQLRRAISRSITLPHFDQSAKNEGTNIARRAQNDTFSGLDGAKSKDICDFGIQLSLQLMSKNLVQQFIISIFHISTCI